MLRIKFSVGRQFSASKSASSPCAKPLYATLGRHTPTKNIDIRKTNLLRKNQTKHDIHFLRQKLVAERQKEKLILI